MVFSPFPLSELRDVDSYAMLMTTVQGLPTSRLLGAITQLIRSKTSHASLPRDIKTVRYAEIVNTSLQNKEIEHGLARCKVSKWTGTAWNTKSRKSQGRELLVGR